MRIAWPVPPRVLVLAGVCYALFAASVSHWFTRATGLSRWTMQPAGPAIAFANLFVVNLAVWCGWAGFALVVFHLGRRVRIDRRRLAPALLFHAVASIMVASAHIAVVATVRWSLQTLWGLEPVWWASVYENFFRTIDAEVPVYWALIALQHAVDSQREARAREVAAATLETRLVEAQLQSLQRQLHPHFLFNTLHAVSALFRRDPDKADEMIERLSDLLRVTLNKVGVHEVPLAEELEHLRAYLDIEQVHLGDRLRVEYRIDPDTLDALVPYLLLQPLAENAIRHGLEPLAHGGELVVETRREGPALHVRVTDSGIGLSADRSTMQAEGVGLGNTRARLERLYRSDASLAIGSAGGGRGVEVHIAIPFRTSGDRPEEVPVVSATREVAPTWSS